MKMLSDDANILVAELIGLGVKSALPIIKMAIDEGYVDFVSGFTGGNFFLVESEEDLKDITTFKINGEGTYYSLYERSETYDYVEVHDNSIASIFIATNNAGGPTYLIPKKFWKDTVIESIKNYENNAAISCLA